MLATAHLMGELDPRGVPCPVCRGDAVTGESECTHCEDGRLRPTPEQERGEGFAYDALLMARLVLQSRERAWSPIEWLDLPAEFAMAVDTASAAIADIEERESRG